jgi:hypothetical protein
MQDTSSRDKRLPIRILFPRLQSRMLTFVLAAIGTSLVVHSLVSVISLTAAARALPSDGKELHAMIVGMLLRDLLLALVITAPAFALLAMAAFMRVIGPLYRMRVFLRAVVEGRQKEPCRLRRDDELQDFCELLNQVTEPMRNREPEEALRRAA